MKLRFMEPAGHRADRLQPHLLSAEVETGFTFSTPASTAANAYLFGANPVNTKAIFISHCLTTPPACWAGWV